MKILNLITLCAYISIFILLIVCKYYTTPFTTRKCYLETNIQLPNEMVATCDQNSHQIKFWLLNNYKIEVIIEFSDQLS